MLKLNLKILSQAKKIQSDQGFTMLEALVAMIIALGFVATSLQAIVIATAFRVKAQEKELATQLIQEEIENIKWIANTFEQVPNTNPPRYNVVLSRCTANTPANGYAQALWDGYVASTSYSTQPSKTVAGSRQVGLRRLSEDLFAASTPPAYNLPTSNAPHHSLKIWYEVREWDGTNFLGDTNDPDDSSIIAKDYIEVIPNAALQCP